MINLKELTISKARQALDAREFSAVDLAQTYLDEIAKKNKELNVYLEVFSDVLEQAKLADERIAKGESKPMLGIPLAIKDNILIQGHKASAASKILENYVATYDATVIAELKNEGAVFLGRVNTDEFAMGSSTENSAYGVTKNPHSVSRVPGGSSGGPAAAVAANLALAALGSDTGGSIRLPASFCGVVGLKPTYGNTSRYGLIAMGSSLDCIGPLAKNSEDAEILHRAIHKYDVFDSTSLRQDESSPKQGTVIGVPWSLVNKEGINPEIKENFKHTVEKLEQSGYKVKDITIENIELALSAYYIIMPAEASTNLSRFDGLRYGVHQEGEDLLTDYLATRGNGFGKEVRRRILLGTYVLSAGYYDAYYGKAQQARSALRDEFNKVFQEVDLVLTPTAPEPPWKIGEKGDPLSIYLADIFTVTANIVGLPAMSLPSGFMELGGKKLPLGVQFMAPHMAEKSLFEIGKKFEIIKEK